MEPKKKKLLCLAGILLCVCVAALWGVWQYLSNYNLKTWYSLQNEKTQQEARTQFERYVKLYCEVADYSGQQAEITAEIVHLTDKILDCSEYSLEFIKLKIQCDDLLEESKRIGSTIDYNRSQMQQCLSTIEQLGFRGETTYYQIKDILNNG